jgi:type II secretory pathway pseudopilin PulG
MNKYCFYREGQTLVEMIVLIGMVVLLTTGIVAGTTVSLSRSHLSQSRTSALALAQSGIELARGIRDNGWGAFEEMGKPGSKTYCVGLTGNFVEGMCTGFNIDNKFMRSITLKSTTISGVSTIKVTSHVSWADTTNPANSMELITYLTPWSSE